MHMVGWGFESFLIGYLVLYILVLYVYSVVSFKKKYDVDPRVTDREDEVMYVFQIYRNILFASVTVTVAVYVFFPSVYGYLIPIDYLELPLLRLIGMLLLVGSLILTRISQHQLKESWRIGIDRTGRQTPLITTGVYRHSRNPIALGMTLTTVGFFLVLPNMITFTVVNLTVLIFTVRIRIEEQHMEEMHGDIYAAYRQKTRRWL